MEEAVREQNQDVGDRGGDGNASSLQQKHAAMLHRLAINDDARIQKFAARRAGSLSSENPNESTDRFLHAFSESFKQLEQNLSYLHSRVSLEDAKSSLKSDLDLAALKISELERFVAENSYFLPAYEVRASQSSIATLREKLEAVNAELLPRKRFSFKSKAGKDRKASEEGAVKAASQPVQADASGAAKVPQDLQAKSREVENSEAADATVAEKVQRNKFYDGALVLPCAIRDLQGVVVVRDLKNQEDSEFILENLVDCRVYVRGICRAMYAHNLKACKVYAGPVTGSALIEEAEDCTFMLASHQIRIHHAKKSDMYLHVRSRPIVEYTSDIRFAPYAFSYQGIGDDLQAAGLSEETGLWEHVDDFRWLRSIPSPNWSVLPNSQRALLEDGSAVLPGED